MTEKKKKEESQKISRKKRLLVKKVFFPSSQAKDFSLVFADCHYSCVRIFSVE